MIERLDQYFHVSNKKTVLLFALLIVNALSACLIGLIAMLIQDANDFWLVMAGGYLGYFCYFLMLAAYISAFKAERGLSIREILDVTAKSLLFSILFYSCSSILSYSAFTMLINDSNALLSMTINLMLMLFILFYIPYSLICLFNFDTSSNPFMILYKSAKILFIHIRKCLGFVCIIAALEGCYMGLSNQLFHTSLTFNPLAAVTEILTQSNPWAAMLSVHHIMHVIFNIIFGLLFTFVFFYGLYAMKEITENQ